MEGVFSSSGFSEEEAEVFACKAHNRGASKKFVVLPMNIKNSFAVMSAQICFVFQN